MDLTPAQLAVRLICGVDVPQRRIDDFQARVRAGHDMLVSLTRKDFGYDLAAWHEHLKHARQDGYDLGRSVAIPALMATALKSTKWRRAVQDLSNPAGAKWHR